MFLTTFFFICIINSSHAYSVLTHEALIDANWNNILLPLLKQKYPASTEDELKEAHAYAYGGAVIPDMGYFPGGSKLFTNLIHYVRTGDFVLALLNGAHNLDEYAFALGALCHYEADKYGHRIGINPGVPIVYPKLERKFGNAITYEQNPVAHVRIEFSFDVLQTARGNYATAIYHDYIGFKVARPVLEKAFLETYGIDVNDLFRNLSRTIGTFRWIVKDLFPIITRSAWASKKGEIKKRIPGATGRRFIYTMHRKNYYREYVTKEERPPFFANILSLFIRIAPKIGPLRVLKFKIPDADAEKIFINSFDTTVANYSYYIGKLYNGPIALSNIDFDTGLNTAPGEYGLADKTYYELLMKLNDKQFATSTPALQENILAFYIQYKPDTHTKRQIREWHNTENALKQLRIKNGN